MLFCCRSLSVFFVCSRCWGAFVFSCRHRWRSFLAAVPVAEVHSLTGFLGLRADRQEQQLQNKNTGSLTLGHSGRGMVC